MPAYYETGHAKNVANFQDLIAFVTGYGATYNPTKNALKLQQLNTLYTNAQASLADVVTKNTAYNNAVNARIASFDGFRALCTRLVNALQTTDASVQKIADAKGFNRKIQGQRTTKTATPVDTETPAPTTISSSHQSYDQLIQHFAGLISVLQSEPTYTPNENDLKIATLTAKQADMTAKNTALATAFTAISNARIARDKVLYKETTGLVDTAKAVKLYIKSIFGARSAEYAQVSVIEFKKVKK
ncbi:MAG: hypothetical protein IT275_06620 [Chitinophagales bacterium]|nr:hypothetical protein [Chitinophagales bacterium]